MRSLEDLIARFGEQRRIYFHARTDLEADLCEWYGLNSGQARVAAILYDAQMPMSMDQLTALSGVKRGSMNKYIPRIREALGENAIPNVRRLKDGYWMTSAGRAACDEATANVGMKALRARLLAERAA